MRTTPTNLIMIFAAVVLPLLLGSCVARTIRTSAHGAVSSEIISNPPGARIEVEGNYIGNAPLTYAWPWSYRDGSRFNNEVTVKAYPVGAGFPQKKFFESHGGTLPVIPAKIYFDMRSPETSKPNSD